MFLFLLCHSSAFYYYWPPPPPRIQTWRDLPPEFQQFFANELALQDSFDSDDYLNGIDPSSGLPLPNNNTDCQLSGRFFNLLNETTTEKALSLTIDVSNSSCQAVKLKTRTLWMKAEKWLAPMFDNFSDSALTDYLSKCKAEEKSRNASSAETLFTTAKRCPLVKGRRVLINYAGANCCARSQKRNCLTGLLQGGFDYCVSFNEKSLDAEFADRNCLILRRRSGAGLWLWKPYVIYRTLLSLDDGDVLFYADSGSEFIDNIDDSLICQQAKLKQDIVVFSVGLPEEKYTKNDAFILMGCNSDGCRKSYQRLASFVMLRKSHVSLRFVGEWLTYAQDWRIISNQDVHLFGNKSAGFVGHRNDQSILSLLSKKWNIDVWPDPSNYGNSPDNDIMNALKRLDRFKFMQGVHYIHHSRDKF